eukprot:COSAG04_NODE_1180_length_7903_cov_22.082394_6_plen_412_part_00
MPWNSRDGGPQREAHSRGANEVKNGWYKKLENGTVLQSQESGENMIIVDNTAIDWQRARKDCKDNHFLAEIPCPMYHAKREQDMTKSSASNIVEIKHFEITGQKMRRVKLCERERCRGEAGCRGEVGCHPDCRLTPTFTGTYETCDKKYEVVNTITSLPSQAFNRLAQSPRMSTEDESGLAELLRRQGVTESEVQLLQDSAPAVAVAATAAVGPTQAPAPAPATATTVVAPAMQFALVPDLQGKAQRMFEREFRASVEAANQSTIESAGGVDDVLRDMWQRLATMQQAYRDFVYHTHLASLDGSDNFGLTEATSNSEDEEDGDDEAEQAADMSESEDEGGEQAEEAGPQGEEVVAVVVGDDMSESEGEEEQQGEAEQHGEEDATNMDFDDSFLEDFDVDAAVREHEGQIVD